MLTTRSLNSTLDRMLTLNRALDQAFASGLSTDGHRMWVPAMDIVEKQDVYAIHAELPGVDSSNVDISFEQNVLTIRGRKEFQKLTEQGELRVHVAERIGGTFERSVRLPEFVDADRIVADFTNGVLTVTVPKAKAAQPRRVEINATRARPVGSEGN